MVKAIYFDMDGTIADLYSVPNWLEQLKNNNPKPYYEAKPLVDMEELCSLLTKFQKKGIIVGVVSWGAMGANPNYNWLVRSAKRRWLKKYFNNWNEIHVIPYGKNKKKVCNIQEYAILIDDCPKVRQSWDGETIDASNCEEMMKNLRELLKSLD